MGKSAQLERRRWILYSQILRVSLLHFRHLKVNTCWWISGPAGANHAGWKIPMYWPPMKDLKQKILQCLGVSLDRSRDAWIKAIQDDKLVWSQVSDLKFWNNAVAVQYRIQQIPQNFLIDPNGKIVGKNLRGPDLDSRLCALLGCN